MTGGKATEIAVCTVASQAAANAEVAEALAIGNQGGVAGILRSGAVYDHAIVKCLAFNAKAVLKADAAAKVAPTELKNAAAATRSAILSVKTELSACPPPAPAPPPPSGLGGSCSAQQPCQVGLLCTGGVCKKVGVLVNGACDANQLCLPTLECRNGTCRLPCACMLPCFTESGACLKNVTKTQRQDCALKSGFCVAPCFRDANNACKKDVPVTVKESCAKTCP